MSPDLHLPGFGILSFDDEIYPLSCSILRASGVHPPHRSIPDTPLYYDGYKSALAIPLQVTLAAPLLPHGVIETALYGTAGMISAHRYGLERIPFHFVALPPLPYPVHEDRLALPSSARAWLQALTWVLYDSPRNLVSYQGGATIRLHIYLDPQALTQLPPCVALLEQIGKCFVSAHKLS